MQKTPRHYQPLQALEYLPRFHQPPFDCMQKVVGGVCRRVIIILHVYISIKEFTIVFSHFHQLLGAFWPLVDRTQPPLCQ